jgi:hypothetical protein
LPVLLSDHGADAPEHAKENTYQPSRALVEAAGSFVSPLICGLFKTPSHPRKEEVRRMNGANGMSDIEGKAAQGSSERVWATNEFQLRIKN